MYKEGYIRTSSDPYTTEKYLNFKIIIKLSQVISMITHTI